MTFEDFEMTAENLGKKSEGFAFRRKILEQEIVIMAKEKILKDAKKRREKNESKDKAVETEPIQEVDK